jgi:ribosomal RNA-processing protein 36
MSGNTTEEEDFALEKGRKEHSFEELLQHRQSSSSRARSKRMHDEGQEEEEEEEHVQQKALNPNTEKNRAANAKKKPLVMGTHQRKAVAPVFDALLHETSKKPKARDPRFDEMAGEFSESKFRQSYRFIEDLRKKEVMDLKERIKETKDWDEKKGLQRELAGLMARVTVEEKKAAAAKVHSELRKKEIEAVRQGKKPFYIKKTDEHKMVKMQQLEKLQDEGRLDKYLAKKRKKVAAKEHRYMPYQRRNADE